MVELIIAMVAILALCAGMIQLATLTKTQTDAMFEARYKASQNMFSDSASVENPKYIRYWEEGGDKKRMTADDTTTDASGTKFRQTIVDRTVADASDWQYLQKAPDDQFLQLSGSYTPVDKFGLLGASESRTVDLLPAVQHLLYDSDSLEVKADVWMTWTRGIY